MVTLTFCILSKGISLTCLCVTLRTSPTYMIRPWCRTMPTVIESSHTSDATYLSTWMPKSLSTNRPAHAHTHIYFSLQLLGRVLGGLENHACLISKPAEYTWVRKEQLLLFPCYHYWGTFIIKALNLQLPQWSYSVSSEAVVILGGLHM